MTIQTSDPELPVHGATEVSLPVEKLWEAFADPESWPAWNPCFARVWTRGGRLSEGSRFFWLFNPIRPWYLYRLPAVARIVEWRPCERVAWEVRLPGFHALHRYTFERLDADRARFGSWEVAEGPGYERLRAFWLAHFKFVCRSSLDGAQGLAQRGVGVRLRSLGDPDRRPPLVAIPGLDGSIGSIEPLVERLAADRRVLVADYTAEHNPTLERLAHEIATAARSAAGVEIDLLGQSIGTLMAAEIAAAADVPVRRVVLIGTFTRVRGTAVRVANVLSAVSPYALQRLTAPALMAIVCGPVGDGRHHPFFAASRRSIFSRTRRRSAWQVGRKFAGLLQRVDRPLLVLLGARDRFPPRRDAAHVRAAVEPRGRLAVIPGAGHVLLPSRAIEIAASEIDRFLA